MNRDRRANLGADHPCRNCDVSAKAVCNTLDERRLADLRNRGCEINLRPEQTLFHQGDRADCVYSLTSGVVKLYADLPDGRRQVVAFHFPGEFIGFCAMPEYHCSAEAVSNATLCRFRTDRFEQFAHEHPALASSRQRRLSNDLVSAQKRAVLLGRATALERLACFLVDVRHRSQPGSAHAPSTIQLPMRRADIADYLGVTKETVSRELTALRRAGIIRTRPGRQLEILDDARFNRLAFGEPADDALPARLSAF